MDQNSMREELAKEISYNYDLPVRSILDDFMILDSLDDMQEDQYAASGVLMTYHFELGSIEAFEIYEAWKKIVSSEENL